VLDLREPNTLCTMKSITKRSEGDMLWQWARAEAESARFRAKYGFPERIAKILKDERRADLGKGEREQIEKSVRAVRLPILEGLMRKGVEWYEGVLDFEELSTLRVMNWPALVHLSPSRTLRELAETLDRGVPAPRDQDFAASYRNLRPIFRLADLRGMPIVVAESVDGPYTIMEGYCRLSALMSKYLAKEVERGEITVMLGVSPRLRAWRHVDPRTHLETPLGLY